MRKSFVPIKLTTHSLCLKCCYRYTWKGRLLQANIFFYNRGCLNKLVGRKYDANSVFKQGVTSNRARLFRFSPSRGFHLLELTMFYYRKWNIYKKKGRTHTIFSDKNSRHMHTTCRQFQLQWFYTHKDWNNRSSFSHIHCLWQQQQQRQWIHSVDFSFVQHYMGAGNGLLSAHGIRIEWEFTTLKESQ